MEKRIIQSIGRSHNNEITGSILSDQLAKGLKINPNEHKQITILLLGETGVGKSTFINALINYLLYDNLDEASKEPICFIPTNFSDFDPVTNKLTKITFGEPDSNESKKSTESSTQSCRCYELSYINYSIKIIDTPGIGDTKGLEADNRHLQQLLSFISKYKELNAICILLKPNNARIGIVFRYCILQLLSQLNKTASNNIIFCFTNCRGTLYKPGDSAAAVLEILEQVKSKPPYVDIKFDKDNIYCFDNESFRYLASVSAPNNIVFEDNIKKEFENSWKISVNESHRLFGYINELKPHLIQETISINDVRRNIILLAKPMTDISKHLMSNINRCKEQQKIINEYKGTIKDLEEQLYIPSLEIVCVPLDKPITVCSDKRCCEEQLIQGVTKTHYKQICHKPCYLDNPEENIIGNKALLDCQAFNIYENKEEGSWSDPAKLYPDQTYSDDKLNESGNIWAVHSIRTKTETCNVCKHSFQTHLTISYETKCNEIKIRDETKQKQITNNVDKIKAKEETIQNIESRKSEIEKELKYINECSAYFAYFLKTNAICPLNDAIEGYLKQLIYNQNSGISPNGSNTSLQNLEEMLKLYLNEKKIIEKAMRDEKSKTFKELEPKEVAERIKKLVNLKHYGNVINKHLEALKMIQIKSHVESKEKKVNLLQSISSSASKIFNNLFKYFK